MGISYNPLIFSGLDLTGGAAGAVQWREPVANEAALPIAGNQSGEARVTLDTDKIYVWDAAISRWVDTGITTATFGTTPNSNGQTIAFDDSTPNIRRRTLALQPADATNPGGVSTTAQSIAGVKTFLDQVKIDEASNQLVLGTTTTTTITAPNPAANRVVTLPDGGTNSSIVITESDQTINGTKTFSSNVLANGGVDVTATAGTDTLTIGGSNADIVNIGRSGATINIVGTTINQTVTNLNVTDKNITLNSGGSAGSGATSGIDVEEAGGITGYVEVSGDRNSWTLKAPNTAGVATITPGASGITINQSSHDPVTLAAVGSSPNGNAASLSGQQITLQPANGSNPGVVSTGTQTFAGDKTFSGSLKTQTSLILEDPGVGTNTITIQAPTLAGSYTLTLPAADGAIYQFLRTDGAGNISFDYHKHANSLYHVSADGRSQYTSIQAAITAAEAAGPSFLSPKFILIHGSFTEDLVISKTGIMLVGESSQRHHFNRINGSLTINKLSNVPDSVATQSLVYVGGLYFTKAVDNFITVSGTNPQRIVFEGCVLSASSNSVFQMTNSGTNSKVPFFNCTIQVEASAAKTAVTAAAGWVDFQNCLISNPTSGGTSVAASDGAFVSSRNTEFDGVLTFANTSRASLGTSTIATLSGPAITTTSTNILGVAVGNCSFTVPAATNSITGTGYVYHANNINGGLGGGFASTVAASGFTTDTGNLRLPNRGTITLSETLANGQNTLTITPPASVVSDLTYTVPDVGLNANFVMTEGAQTINGTKTFTSNISAPNLSGTNTGDITLAPVGSSPNGNAATLTGQQLNLEPANATNPGVVTTGTQTLAGAKTFSSLLTAQSSIALTGHISSADYVDFTNGAGTAYNQARLFYDQQANSLSYYTDISGIRVHLGYENVIRVRNTTGSTITKGKAVYINGVNGQYPTIALGQANSSSTCQVIAIVQQDVTDGSFTDAVSFGLIDNLDTSAFLDGQTVYLSATSAGLLTATPPISPNYELEVGVIVYAHPTQGKILVNISTPKQKTSGDVAENSWSGLANNTANQSITGLSFANASVRGFKADVSAYINATSPLYSKFTIEGIQKSGSWEISSEFTGDTITGVAFNITAAGQVQISIGNITGFTSGSIHFRATALAV